MNKEYKKGFTIVELLVVIVVIGILAAITIVSYSGITNRANIASITSDLVSSKKILALYYVDNDAYPTTLDGNNCPLTPVNDNRYCLKFSSGNTFSYSGTPTTYALTVTRNSLNYNITQNSNPTVGIAIVCPTGFIIVPGSATYNTGDFCVMKYEAKADNNGDGLGDTDVTTGYNTWPSNTHPISATRKLVSSAAGYPVANISQTTAITAASSANFVYGCNSGCHLITEAEWMTIVQNVLSVPSNWSSGVIGTGYVFSGHNDNVPGSALIADASGADSYYLTGQSSGNQRRTLTLTNGEVIWDMAGNAWEWTSGQMTGGQPAGMSSWNWYPWPGITGGSFTVNPYPSGTGLSGSGGWNSTNGIGQIYGSTNDVATRGFHRGGYWSDNTSAGIATLALSGAPTYNAVSIGFRVAK